MSANQTSREAPRWRLTLAVIFFAQMMSAVGFSMVFPFLPLYVQDLGSLTGMSVELMAGLVISVQGFTMMIASPLWGNLADRYGRKLMVMRSMFGGTVVLALMGLVSNAEQLIVLRAVQGLITGTVAANNALVASVVPRDRVGFSMGLLQVGLWGGVALGPFIGGFLADTFGFALPFFITASALFLAGVLTYFGVDEHFEPPVEDEAHPRPSMVQQWQHVMSAHGVSMVYLTRFLSGLGRDMIIPIAPLFVVSLLPATADHSSMAAGSVLAVSSAAATLSGVALGQLGDSIGHRKVLIGAALLAVVAYIPQVFVSSVWQLLGLQALAGLALGGVIAAPSALLARYTEPGEEGAVYGLNNAIVAGGRAVAPMIGAGVALLFGMRGTFAASAVLFAVVVAVGLVLLPNDQPETQYRAAVAAGD